MGGIQANNTNRADFVCESLQIQSNLIRGAHAAGVQRLMFLSLSCIYPRDGLQPIREDHLLFGPLVNVGTGEGVSIRELAEILMGGGGLPREHGLRCLETRRRTPQATRHEQLGQPGLARTGLREGIRHAYARYAPPALIEAPPAKPPLSPNPASPGVRPAPLARTPIDAPQKAALITGVTGQQSAYPPKLLLEKG